MQDGNYYSKLDKKGDNSQINSGFRTGQAFTLVDSKDIEIEMNNYTFKDERKFFSQTKLKKFIDIVQNQFTTSTTKTKKLEKLSDDKVMYADFSPSGEKVAYINSNNLFVKDLSNGKTIQITGWRAKPNY